LTLLWLFVTFLSQELSCDKKVTKENQEKIMLPGKKLALTPLFFQAKLHGIFIL
jgi:hypothetical protein